MEDKELIVGKYKVKVLRDACISAGSCIAVSPGVFQFDEENKAIIVDGAQDEDANILMAAQSCPTKAIILTDTETGEQVWPN